MAQARDLGVPIVTADERCRGSLVAVAAVGGARFAKLMGMSSTKHSPFATIDEALEDIHQGKMVVVCDDEDRENEGDLTMAAQFATPEADQLHGHRTAAA